MPQFVPHLTSIMVLLRLHRLGFRIQRGRQMVWRWDTFTPARPSNKRKSIVWHKTCWKWNLRENVEHKTVDKSSDNDDDTELTWLNMEDKTQMPIHLGIRCIWHSFKERWLEHFPIFVRDHQTVILVWYNVFSNKIKLICKMFFA